MRKKYGEYFAKLEMRKKMGKTPREQMLLEKKRAAKRLEEKKINFDHIKQQVREGVQKTL